MRITPAAMRMGSFVQYLSIVAATNILRLCIARWGIAAFWAWCAAVCAVGLIIAAYFLISVLRLRNLKRGFCDEAIQYARKQRAAFDQPDFDDSELKAMARCRRKNDCQQIYEIIKVSDLSLLQSRNRLQSAATDKLPMTAR